MSLFGAMQSGISGLAAQSSSMSAISDNISNVNTIGYKGNNVAFQTLVTKQTSTNAYSPGGVQPVSKQGINVQGLLAANSASTAMAISGNGFFVVNQASNPGEGDMWAYTRAGDFGVDDTGYLKNTGGYYAQGWSLLPWDNNPNATVVKINGVNYMKAYYAADGSTQYINDNIVDNRNLRPVNLSNIGGTATPTQQLSFGANLPSNAPIFDPTVPSAGGKYAVSGLIYDSLGNASNLSLNYTKESANGWGMSATIPSGAATMILRGSAEKSDGGVSDVYSAAGQLEFTAVPANGSTITITDDSANPPKNYTFEFLDNGGTAKPGNIGVDVKTGVTNVSDFIQKFAASLKENVPGANRFTADTNKINIIQSTAGGQLTINASKTLSCVQAAVNPVHETGVPTGVFVIPEIDEDIKNVGRFDFTSNLVTDYIAGGVSKDFTVDGKTFAFVNGGVPTATQIDIASAIKADGTLDLNKLVQLTTQTLRNNLTEPDRFVASGSSLEIIPTSTGDDIKINFNGLAGVTGKVRNNGQNWVDTGVNNTAFTITNKFNVNTTDVITGSMVPAVRFNSDGTPKFFYVDEMDIEWANGAENMTGDYGEGTPIKLNMGNVGTNEGLTSLSGNFNTAYIKQDGAKFGSYAGVSVDENGVVTALFDNGETRPIAILPLATFANSNGMNGLTGNSWIETDSSGQPLLKQAGTNGAGEIASNALEQSTVDLATEFSNMIVTQRAYSASSKIITTASDMLDELTRMV